MLIYDSTGVTLKRSVLGLNTPLYSYTAAQQVTDFGSTQSFAYVVVYQNSAVVGRGFAATNPTCGEGNVISGGSDATSILGVNIVGTPLTSLANIVATGDKTEVFNGYCGAESGQVPVSAAAPAMLFSQLEVQKRARGTDRPPILPPPGADDRLSISRLFPAGVPAPGAKP